MNRMRMLVGLAMLGGLCGLVGLSAAAEDKKEDKEKADHGFALKASASGLAEVNLSELAKLRAHNSAVREFAQHMVTDHSQANSELLAIANRHQIPLAKQPDEKHQKMFEKLSKLDGKEFDHTYMEGMVKDHEEAVKLFEDESKNGKNDALKEWAGKKLPTLKKHLEAARKLCKEEKDARKDASTR